MPKNVRVKAAETGKRHYHGALCKKNPEHGTGRYTTSGQCVQCCAESAKKRIGYIRATLKTAVSA